MSNLPFLAEIPLLKANVRDCGPPRPPALVRGRNSRVTTLMALCRRLRLAFWGMGAHCNSCPHGFSYIDKHLVYRFVRYDPSRMEAR